MATTSTPKIQRLDESVVNRIAAGEVIQRPVSALKELLENSLDAGASQINIVVKDGGNKLLHIQDNGHGIRKEDLPLLCVRHATSKLSAYEDLNKINTLGFRGEALASISFVAHLTVTTMLHDAAHGFRAAYRDGEMAAGDPVPCASVPGTTFVVEDLFYNSSARRQALKSSSEEFSRILDIVGSYAVFKPTVGFSVKKQGEARPDLHTLPGATHLENIRTIFGAAVARNVLPLTLAAGQEGAAEDALQFTAEGLITGAEYSGRKATLVLFINGRPVDCPPLKRALEATYAALLPKAAKPFMYLSVQMPGDHVDVNLHPTKREVGFLHQELFIETVCTAVEEKTQLPGAPVASDPDGLVDVQVSTRRDKAGGDHKLVRTDSRAKTLDAFLRPSQPDSPRTSQPSPAQPNGQPQAAALAAARRRGSERGVVRVREQWEAEERSKQAEHARAVRQRPNPVPGSQPESIITLLEEVDADAHPGLAEVIRNHTYVGMADAVLGLLQHGTRLYLVDTTALTRSMFYQQVLRRFGQLKAIRVVEKPSIRELALLALEMEAMDSKEEDEDVSHEEVAGLVQQLLIDKAEMLYECFALSIDVQGRLCTLPRLIEHYAPDMDRLPAFVLAMARDVDWHSEQACFHSIAQALADFYCSKAPVAELDAEPGSSSRAEEQPEAEAGTREQQAEAAAENPQDGSGRGPATASTSALQDESGPLPVVQDADRIDDVMIDADGAAASSLEHSNRQTAPTPQEWTMQHVIFPALRMFLKPGKQMAQAGSVIELTRLESLYRIFERC